MIVAIPVWSDQVSTVFDFAHHILLVELDGSNEIGRSEHPLQEGPPIFRANKLSRFGAEVLICGAISRPLARIVASHGIKIIPFVSGTVNDVLNAYLTGRLADSRFCLPGCRPGDRKDWRRRHRFSGGRW